MSSAIILFYSIYSFLFIELANKIKGRYIVIILFILPFIILIALRSSMVPDTLIYIRYYLVSNTNLFDTSSNLRFEIGYQIINKIIKIFVHDNFRLFFAIITFFNLFLVMCVQKNLSIQSGYLNDNYSSLLLLLLYIPFWGIYHNAVILREGLSISFLLLLSVYCIKNKKIKRILSLLLYYISYRELFILQPGSLVL
ncbi:EpsG family protein [Treponema primitia]|uniref:EpsG family protein n=1 Tax=Treponema primitia TaxID=88058 RepID=UPI0009D9CF40